MLSRKAFGALAALAAVLGLVVAGRWLVRSGERDEGLRRFVEGRYAEADPLLLRAVERDPDDVEVLSALAVGRLNSTAPGSAEAYLTRWCDLSSGDARPFRLRMQLGHRLVRGEQVAAEKLRLTERAADDGLRVLELDSEDDLTRRDVVALLLAAGRPDEAEAAVRVCLAKAPEDPWLHYLRASAIHARGDRAGAEAVLDPVVRGPRPPAEALLLRALLHREADQPHRAVPLLRQALALDRCPPRRECLYQLGLALAVTGETETARRVLAELQLETLQESVAPDYFPKTPAARVQIAEAMLGAGKTEEARALLEAVLKEVADFAPAHEALAAYYDQKGNTGRAAEHRRKAGDKATR